MAILHVLFDGPRTGAVNMQRDGELLERRRPDEPPVLRLYRWRPYAVSHGFHQRPTDFDPEAIARLGFDLVRRPTGGRAILHAEELTYCLVGPSPSPLFGDTLHTCYMRLNEPLVAFLRGLGHDPEISGGEPRDAMRQAVCFKSAGQHEIRIAGRKIVGSAQRRREGSFLQHGSLLTGPRHADLLECLRPQGRGGTTRDELLAATTDLGRLRGRPLDEDELEDLARRLARHFAESLGLEPVTLRWEDLAAGR